MQTDHSALSRELFMQGCNCSQAVFAAFSDLTGLERDFALRISSSFGGGMGRLREVCGAFSGILMVAGCLYGYSDVSEPSLKNQHYRLVQELAARFKERTGSLICREHLGLAGASAPDSPVRTPEFYKTRPCASLIETAAQIMDEYISEHPYDGQAKV